MRADLRPVGGNLRAASMAAAAALLWTAPAHAQTATVAAAPDPAERDDIALTVQERQTLRDRTFGTTIGAVHVQPSASVDLAYNSNVFAAPIASGDAILTARVAITGDFELRRHSGGVNAEIERDTYARLSSEDATQARVAARDTIKLPSDIELSARASFGALVEPRSSTGAPVGAGRPVRYNVVDGAVDVSRRGGRFVVALGAQYSAYDYHDTIGAGGAVVDQEIRDFHYAEVRGRVGYDLGGPQVFVAADRHASSYRRPQPGTGFDRDTQGWQATLGLSSEITTLLRGTLSAGYLHEHFDLDTAATVSALAFNAALDWLPTPITTLHFGASRRLENGASIDASGYLASRLNLRGDHELTRNLLLDLGASYENAAFRSIDRDDDLLAITGGARLQAVGGLSFRLNGTYQQRRSRGAARGFDFNQTVASGGVTYRF
ncbi:MAG: outer membrane beta-barrel protein [Rhizorhabdus sp.]